MRLKIMVGYESENFGFLLKGTEIDMDGAEATNLLRKGYAVRAPAAAAAAAPATSGNPPVVDAAV